MKEMFAARIGWGLVLLTVTVLGCTPRIAGIEIQRLEQIAPDPGPAATPEPTLTPSPTPQVIVESTPSPTPEATAQPTPTAEPVSTPTPTPTPVPAPEVDTVDVLNQFSIKILFTQAIDPSGLVAQNYVLSGSGQGTFSAFPSRVARVSAAEFRLEWDQGEMKNAGDIIVSVNSVQSDQGVSINPLRRSGIDVGGAIGVAPIIAEFVVQSHSEIDVTFSEPMGTSALELGAYVLSGSGQGSFAIAPDQIEYDGESTYRLIWNTGAMVDGGDLTVAAPGASDLAGNQSMGTRTVLGGGGSPPVIQTIADQVTRDGVATGIIAFTIADFETDPANLQLSAVSEPSSMIASFVFDGTGVDRTLVLKPTENQTGAATVFVTVNDGTHEATTSFSLVVTAYCASDALANVPFAGGTGSSEDPYRICTASQLQAIGQGCFFNNNNVKSNEHCSRNFSIKDDIDLSGYTGTQFNLIGGDDGTGSGAYYFSGTIEGNGHAIDHFSYTKDNDSAQDDRAFIRYLGAGGSLRNLRFVDASVSVNWGQGAAIVVAEIRGAGTELSNVDVVDGTVDALYEAGLLLGVSKDDPVFIYDSHVSGLVTVLFGWGRSDAGGLLGSAAGTGGIISRSSASVSVSGTGNSIGGLAGTVEHTEISDSYATGSVSGSANQGSYIGGLVGKFISNATNGILHRSYSTAATSGRNAVGGLVGAHFGTSINQLNHHNFTTGAVLCAAGQSCGPISGYPNGYSTPNIYFDSGVSCVNCNAGGSPLGYKGTDRGISSGFYFDPTSEVFSDWDFTGVWLADPASYPVVLDK